MDKNLSFSSIVLKINLNTKNVLFIITKTQLQMSTHDSRKCISKTTLLKLYIFEIGI